MQTNSFHVRYEIFRKRFRKNFRKYILLDIDIV